MKEQALSKEVLKILDPFEKVAKVVSGEQYITRSLDIILIGGLLNFEDESLKIREKEQTTTNKDCNKH